MDINKMKIGLSYIFFENQKIDEMTKKQVLNYIEAADMEQLKLLALDGDIHADLTKDARKIINVRFSENFEIVDKIEKAAIQGIHELISLKELGPFTTPLKYGYKGAKKFSKQIAKTAKWGAKEAGSAAILGLMVAGPIWAAYRTARAAFSADKRRCGVYGVGKARTVCLTQAKISKLNKEISLVKQNSKSCSNAKDSAKCNQKHSAAITKATNKIMSLKRKIAQLPNAAHEKGEKKFAKASAKVV